MFSITSKLNFQKKLNIDFLKYLSKCEQKMPKMDIILQRVERQESGKNNNDDNDDNDEKERETILCEKNQCIQ